MRAINENIPTLRIISFIQNILKSSSLILFNRFIVNLHSINNLLLLFTMVLDNLKKVLLSERAKRASGGHIGD